MAKRLTRADALKVAKNAAAPVAVADTSKDDFISPLEPKAEDVDDKSKDIAEVIKHKGITFKVKPGTMKTVKTGANDDHVEKGRGDRVALREIKKAKEVV